MFKTGVGAAPKNLPPKPSPPKALKKGSKVQETSSHETSKKEELFSKQVGEDAYFVRQDALGVADGVGGWITVQSKGVFILYSCRLSHA
jgi:hypothetical protein